MSDGKSVRIDGFDSLYATEVWEVMLEFLPLYFVYSLRFRD